MGTDHRFPPAGGLPAEVSGAEASVLDGGITALEVAVTTGAFASETVGSALERIGTQGNGATDATALGSAASHLVGGDGGGSIFSVPLAELSDALSLDAKVESLSDLGVTASAAELNLLDGVTASTAELNLLDGVTASTAELNYVDGVTSAIQTQLDSKAPLASPTFTGTPAAPTASQGNNSTQIATTAYVDTAVAASSSGWTTITKATDETIQSDSTMTSDSALVLPVSANTKYRFRLLALFSTDGTSDFKFQLAGPASPTNLNVRTIVGTPNSSATSYRSVGAYSFWSGFAVDGSGTGTDQRGFVFLEGVLHNGSNSGTLAFEWAQNTSNASNTTVSAGSYLEWKQV